MKSFRIIGSLLFAVVASFLIIKRIGIIEGITFSVGLILIVANVVTLSLIYNKKIKFILNEGGRESVGGVLGLIFLKMVILSGVLFTTIVVFHAPGLYLFIGSLIGLVLILLNLSSLLRGPRTEAVVA